MFDSSPYIAQTPSISSNIPQIEFDFIHGTSIPASPLSAVGVVAIFLVEKEKALCGFI